MNLNSKLGPNSGFSRSTVKVKIVADCGPGSSSHPLSDLFNVKIDYISRANVPIMEIKARYCLTSEIVYSRVINKEQIKSVIRICGQTDQIMVVTQLQALICISEGLNGKKLYLNFDKLKDKLTQGV